MAKLKLIDKFDAIHLGQNQGQNFTTVSVQWALQSLET